MALHDVQINYTGGKQGWPGDVPNFSYDTQKLLDLGWSPTFSSNEAVKKTVKELIKK